MQTVQNKPSEKPSAVQPSADKIRPGAVVGGVVNAVINSAIQFWLLRGQAQIALTVDGIMNDQPTVFGTAVPLAVSLAMILTAIAHFTLKTPKRPFFPDMLWLTFKHGIFAFGLIVSGVWPLVTMSPACCAIDLRVGSTPPIPSRSTQTSTPCGPIHV